MIDLNKIADKAKSMANKVKDAAIEAAPQAKTTMQELGKTANVFVAALKNKPEMATKEED